MKVDGDNTAGRSSRPLTILIEGDGDPRHGTRNGYSNHGCRCPLCRDAVNAYARELRRRKQVARGAV